MMLWLTFNLSRRVLYLDLAQLVLAQHHRLKTRLLDVTRNPLVALFCACKKAEIDGRLHAFSVPKNLVKPYNSDTVSIISNFCKLSRLEQKVLLGWRAEDIEELETDPEIEIRYDNVMGRLYHLIRQEKPNFKKLIDPRDFFRVIIVDRSSYFRESEHSLVLFSFQRFMSDSNKVRFTN